MAPAALTVCGGAGVLTPLISHPVLFLPSELLMVMKLYTDTLKVLQRQKSGKFSGEQVPNAQKFWTRKYALSWILPSKKCVNRIRNKLNCLSKGTTYHALNTTNNA